VKHWPEDQSAELDELMDLSPDDFVQRVREKYAAKNLELDWEHVRRTFPPEWGPGPRGRSGPGGGSRPPGETGDSRRGPQNNE
jgi:hypothetical protein